MVARNYDLPTVGKFRKPVIEVEYCGRALTEHRKVTSVYKQVPGRDLYFSMLLMGVGNCHNRQRSAVFMFYILLSPQIHIFHLNRFALVFPFVNIEFPMTRRRQKFKTSSPEDISCSNPASKRPCGSHGGFD